jgi:DNA topoisomerase-2
MTIVNLAQDYVGSNNLNFLLPNGHYRTRDQGGKDTASARYIFTEPALITRTIFHPADLKEDNDQIEPEWYIPVIPLVLINAAESIGTGLSQIPSLRLFRALMTFQIVGRSTSVPSYNPKDVVANIRRLMASKKRCFLNGAASKAR